MKLKKFWEWMVKKGYAEWHEFHGEKSRYMVVGEYCFDFTKQMLVGHKAEYLCEMIGSLTLKYYHNLNKLDKHLDSLIRKLERS